jgi:YidC/Oxa1 family membrane protein insertase
MDTQRIIALVVFFASSFLLWEAWQKQQHPPTPAQEPTIASTPTPTKSGSSADTAAVPATNGPVAPAVAQTAVLPQGQRVTVQTDTLSAEIDTAGGDLRKLVLIEHFAAEDQSRPFVLMQDKGEPLYTTQSGLLGSGLPNHNTVYTAPQTAYNLQPGQESVQVRLESREGTIKVEKIFTFHRASYVIDESYQITNEGSAPVSPFAYFQFLRDGAGSGSNPMFVSTFTGPAVYTDKDKFVKVNFSDIDKGKENYPKKANDGWLAMVQHYFVAAWLPQGAMEREFYTRKVGDKLYSAGLIIAVGSIEPGKTASLSVPLYAGPQQVNVLARLAPGLELVTDYGWLTIIAAPLFKLLSFIHNWVGNWGVSIILLTVLIKAVFFPLQSKAGRSMARMKVLGPKMQKLKEQFGDDRAKLNQAMMELYKKEKINPLGGCLPIVVQIPVFIALYWVLLASVELRHAPFALWIKDLSAADPYFVLPIVYAATMFVQMRLQPPSPDPMQQKVMMAMPIIFTAMFLFFPSGLVLYWIVNNVLTIAQQWYINRQIEAETAAKGNARK